MGRPAPAPGHGPAKDQAAQGLGGVHGKKSLTRPALAGQAKAGRAANTARKGRLAGETSARLDWVKTLTAKGRGRLRARDLRYRRQPVGSNTLHCVLIDMSASMLRGEKLALAKGCLLALTESFYRRREHLAVIGFSGNEARLLQAPGKVATFNAGWIAPLRGGGGTPVASALQLAHALMQRRRQSCAGQLLSVWLLTDGRFADLPARPALADSCQIVDFENEAIALQRCRRLAQHWDAQWISAAQLRGTRA